MHEACLQKELNPTLFDNLFLSFTCKNKEEQSGFQGKVRVFHQDSVLDVPNLSGRLYSLFRPKQR